MKHFFITPLFILSLFSLSIKAQQSHFIYLQTENKQPFFVKLNDKVFSSASLGFVIIPKLQDGFYSLTVGYPQRIMQEEFNCSINNNDVGFIIKNTGENEWQLLNIQTQSLINPGSVIAAKIIVDTLPKDTDLFSSMLANAVHDSTILQKDYAVEIIPERPNETVLKDSTQISASPKDVAITSKPIIKKSPKKVIAPLHKVVAKKTAVRQKTNLPKVTTPIIVDNKDTLAKNEVTVPVVPNKNIDNDIAKAIAMNDSIVAKKTVLQSDTVVRNDGATTALPQKDTSHNVIDNILKDTTQNVAVNDIVKPEIKKIKKKKKSIEQADSTIVEKEKIKVSEEANVKTNEIKTDTSQVTFIDSELPKPVKQKLKRKKKISEAEDSTALQNITNANADNAIKNETKIDQQAVAPDSNVMNSLSIIKRTFRKSTKEGLELMYIDDNGKMIDTIRILMPLNKIKKQPEDSLNTTLINDTIKNELSTAKSEIKVETIQPVSNTGMLNSDCKNFATDEDFLKVRKKMVAETTDEDMIKVAKKTFKSKCFTTEQIKNLSVLFLKDDGKYMFFDAAYPFVSDSENYSSLQSQLTDNYYITRFRAMIHK